MRTILVVDHQRAQFYAVKTLKGRPVNIASLVNPSAKVTEFELTGSTGGRSLNRASGGYQSFDLGQAAHQGHLQLYIRDIAALLDKMAQEQDCDGIAIVAQPRLLADIKRASASHTLSLLKIEIAKDLAHEPLPALMKRLQEAGSSHG